MEDTFKNIDFLRRRIPITLAHFNNKDLKPTQLFSIGLLERLNSSIFSFCLQLDDYKKFKQLDFSIGLTLRALILDSLFSFNLFKVISDLHDKGIEINEIEKEADFFCNKVLADGLRQTIAYFQTARNVNIIDEAKLKDNFNDLASSYGFFLEPHNLDGSQPQVKFPNPPKNPDLFKSLAAVNDLNFLSRLYDAYNFYSKYDHFGVLYFRVTRLTHARCLYQFKNCISVLMKHFLNLLFILDQFSEGDKILREEIVMVVQHNAQNSC